MISTLFENSDLETQNQHLEEAQDNPKECTCGCLFFTDNTVEQIDHIILEYNRICDGCGNILGTWNTGFWEDTEEED